MWFKNLRIYRFPGSFDLSPEELADCLARDVFSPCGKMNEWSYGWVPPLLDQGTEFVHAANGCIMICAKRQDKLLPSSVVKESLEERVLELEEREGRKLGRKERYHLKEEIRIDLLPRAFVRSSLHYAYITPKQGWLFVDAATDKQAEEFLNALREALGSLPVTPLTTNSQPANIMTSWVRDSSPPKIFDFGDDCELRDPLDQRSLIRCKNQDLESKDIVNHARAGMEVSKLGLTWNGGIDCMVDDKLCIKRLRFADAIKEQSDEFEADDLAQRFDLEFSVMTIQLAAFVDALIEAFGGIDTNRDTI